MAEYIERQAAIDVVARWFKEINLNGDICIDGLRSLPAADVVEVVRCKDCIHASMTSDGTCKYCAVWYQDEALYLDGDYYCADGERKNDG